MAKESSWYSAWTTGDEIQFIRSIGAWCEHTRLSHIELLKRYLVSANKRKNWANIDKEQVLAFVRESIDSYGRK